MDETKACPFCAEAIPAMAVRCPFCRTDLPSPPAARVVTTRVALDNPPARPAADPETSEASPDRSFDPTSPDDDSELPGSIASRIPRKAALAVGVTVVVGAALVFLLRPDTTPAVISFGKPADLIVDYRPVPVEAKVRNKKGGALDVAVAYKVTPPEIATVNPDGSVYCLGRGDVEILATAGGLLGRVPIRCRPVAHMNGPAEVTLALTSRPTKLDIEAFDKAGERYADVPIAMKSSDTSIFRIQGSRIVPVGLGSAALTATVGMEAVRVTVNVADNTLFQKFDLVDGTSKTYHVSPPGTYRVHVKVQGDEAGGTGVELTFATASCASQKEARVHDLSCAFGEGGAVSVSNPAILGIGPDLKVRLSLDRLKTP